MPQVGLKYLVGAKYAESNSSASYTDGAVLAPVTKAEISVEFNEADFFADDVLKESEKAFKQGKITLGVDTLEYDACALVFGQTRTQAGSGGSGGTSTPETLTANISDQPSNIGVGFFAKVLRSGVAKFRAVWFPKVMFRPGSESFETKGDSITFIAPSIEGTVMSDVTGNWKVESMHATEAAAKAWLNTKANITN